jgi:hypothetical protein
MVRAERIFMRGAVDRYSNQMMASHCSRMMRHFS